MAVSMFKAYLELGNVEAIAQKLADDHTEWTGSHGAQAQAAMMVLTLRRLDASIKKMDRTTTRLQVVAILWAVASVGIAIFGLIAD